MANLLRISARRFRVAVRSHLAALIITAAVLAAWLLFWGYTAAMGQSLTARVEAPAFPVDVILASADSLNLSSSYGTKVCSYRQATADTSCGQLPLGLVTSSIVGGPLPYPAAGEVWLPEHLQTEWQIATGADFPLRIRQGYGFVTVTARVAGSYQEFAYDPAILVNARWLRDQGVVAGSRELSLYNLNQNNLAQFNRWLNGAGDTVTVINGTTIAQQARQIAVGTFASGGSAVGLLFLFLTLGVGTFSLLSYLDSRRELAIIKSMGLRPNEIGLLFIIEGGLTASCGFLLALGVTQWVATHTALPVIISGQLTARAAAYAMVAFVFATGIPYTLARQATVNELMLNRPVPLLRSTVSELAKRHPSLEARLAAGLRCIKLPCADGVFPGICFRQVGQGVKRGETVAWESYAWGLGERNYLAPCDGLVVECDLSQGLVVIQPVDSPVG